MYTLSNPYKVEDRYKTNQIDKSHQGNYCRDTGCEDEHDVTILTDRHWIKRSALNAFK